MVREVAVDVAEERGDRAAEAPEELRGVRAGDAVAAVDRDRHRPGEADVPDDALEVGGRDVVRAVGAGAAGEVAGFDPRAQRLDVGARQRLAGDDHLEPVVVGRVVAAGHHHAALRAELVGGEVGHRRRHHADVDDVGPRRADAVVERADELGPGQAAVAAGDDGVAAALPRQRAQCPADRVDDRGRERASDHAADVVGLEDLGRKRSHGHGAGGRLGGRRGTGARRGRPVRCAPGDFSGARRRIVPTAAAATAGGRETGRRGSPRVPRRRAARAARRARLRPRAAARPRARTGRCAR